ncbi:MAG: YetF domain-containing protein [Erythrobacter sp.]|nr:YetF domain-containing protein [Erythrobacter sp.]
MLDNLDIWFNGFDRLERIIVSATAIYVAIIVLVRLSGKRTTSQMNNFDWIITVALGGLVSSGILLDDVSVADALVAAGWLVLLQWAMTTMVIRSDLLANLVKAKPTLLVENGKMLEDNMRDQRISEAEIMGALRENGLHELTQAKWVVLETDASFSVVADTDDRPEEPQILSNVGGRPNQTG